MMNWTSCSKFLAVILLALLVSGCNSAIDKYDTTFTASLPGESSSNISFKKVELAAAKMKLRAVSKRKKPYFMEFRARSAYTYGHASVVFGKLNRNGKLPVRNGVLDPKMVQITGLHPATTSTVPWSVGHVVPVPAETGPSDGDFEEKYVTARYRVDLTEAEFRKLVSIVHKHKRQYKAWYAPVLAANCLGYISSIASDMGLKTPKMAKLPKDYVRALKAANS